jgi:RHS repeat-associated protein
VKPSFSRSCLPSLLTLVALGLFARPLEAEERPNPPPETPTDDESEPSVEPAAVGEKPAAKTAPVDRGVVAPTIPSVSLPSTVLDLPSGGAKTGVSSQAISLPQCAGKLGGMGESFSTNLSTGVGTYSIPIALPAARGGAQPSLALSYSSASGYGVAGVGWEIGVPFIARQTDRGVPNYLDPVNGGAWTPQQDRFIFNGGQELVPICLVKNGDCPGEIVSELMPSWANGWQYFRPRVEGAFLRFFWSADHQTWRVQGKTGTTLELGVPFGTTDTNALEADPANPAHIFRWNLARQYDVEVDTQGRPVNLVVYRYAASGGMDFLSDVYDTPPASNAGGAALSTYAHHTRILYEPRTDPVTSFRRGYMTQQLLRVNGIDVASMAFNPATGDPRQMLRRYHLAYDPAYHTSELQSVVVEGRCASPVVEGVVQGTTESLPQATGCPTLPSTTLGYQHVTQNADLPGYEGFDETLHHIAQSPAYSLDGTNADLFDINADGLPDVVVTLPGFFQGNHGLFLNGGPNPNSLAFSASTISVTGVLGATSTDITLANANVTPHDLDGDGIIDLLHMPLVKTYAVYTPKLMPGGWSWLGRAITTAAAQNPSVDFTNHNADIKVMDVNGDGLVDIVYSAGTEMQTFLSLGRYEGGDGQFGHMVWQGASPPTISNDPLTSCVPWDATPLKLSGPDVGIADMNGDGLPDIVRVRPGQIEYWPGTGNGMWGAGPASACPAGSFGQGLQISMTGSPWISPQPTGLPYLEDLNGDGLADLIQVRFDGVDIWINVDGVSWTANPHTINGTPTVNPIANHVRIVDANGSGTRDLLWGDASDYKYIDLLGGAVPAVLTHVENGYGKTTDIVYSSSTALMLADAQKPATAWKSVTPMPVQVVTSTTEHDNLANFNFGNAGGNYVTQYMYRDPVYEGRQREFRGFRTAGTRKVGDSNSPTSITRSTFLLGECIDENPNDPTDPTNPANTCSPAQRWRDNPREALKGIPVLTETLDESLSDTTAPGYNFLDATGVFASTTHTTVRLRRLYVGLDGREVRTAFTAISDAYLYDISLPSQTAGAPILQTDVELEITSTFTQDLEPSTSVIPRSTVGMVQTSSASEVDFFGNAVQAIAYGCVQGCSSMDETISTFTLADRPSGDTSGWLWRTMETYVLGSLTPFKLHDTFMTYDPLGHLVQTSAMLSGTLPLDRFHEDPTKQIAPPPPGASADGVIVLSTITQRDGFGNVTFETGANGRCRAQQFDASYAQLPTLETIYVGASSGTCGSVALTTMAGYDRACAAVSSTTDLHGEISLVSYDSFCRIVSMTKPDPGVVGMPSALPSMTVAYLLPGTQPNPGNRPYSLVHTQTQDGADPSVKSYRDTWSYVDGFGRTMVTLSQADPTAGDAGDWVASGVMRYDAKGAEMNTYVAFFQSGAPDSGAVLQVPAPMQSQGSRYDPFAHVVESFNLDGSFAGRVVYHALSMDAYDALHALTPATQSRDGHERTVSTIERITAQGTIEQHETRSTYRATGEVTTITRQRLGFPDPPVVRWMQYDSLGRRVLNVDPNTTSGPLPAPNTAPNTFHAWRYAYDDAGDLLGTSDARGCGLNYFYDAAGRALAEDYSPCLKSHADYSAPDFSTCAGVETQCVGVETAYLYDIPDPESAALASATPGLTIPSNLLLGRLASATDRGAKVLYQYDGRGRTTGLGKRVARPGPPNADPTLRYAPRWYVSTVVFDAADRPATTSTGARVPELLGMGQASTVAVQYSKRGTVSSVEGSYGALVTAVIRDANGFVKQVSYGDAAQTTTSSQPDARLRLSTTQTSRAAAPIWSMPPPGYTPPSSSPSTLQLLLEDTQYTYDAVDNPVQIKDFRDPSEWPAGAKPVTRTMTYDDLNRITGVAYWYQWPSQGADTWVSPFAAEDVGPVDSTLARPSPQGSFPNRIQQQSFAYDWLGNTSATADDANGFYDRSLGTVTNGTAASGPYQLQAAANAPGSPTSGLLTAAYDAAGNLTSLAVQRNGQCLPAGASCSQRFVYDWDEVGRLVRARRWDVASAGAATDPAPAATPGVDLANTYDRGNQRVVKTATDVLGQQRYTVYVFSSLELRRTEWLSDPSQPTSDDYDDSSNAEVAYLGAHGVRLARVVFDQGDPTADGGSTHVLLELPDHLGSVSTVIDKGSGELVEKTTYQPFGATESDYRLGRWSSFREDYGFTGKEDDVEVGLIYFGQRFYAPLLGRWMSPDPLAVHSLGADLNLYAYVHGNVFRAVDQLGLDETLPPVCIEAQKQESGYSVKVVECPGPVGLKQPDRPPTIGPEHEPGDFDVIIHKNGDRDIQPKGTADLVEGVDPANEEERQGVVRYRHEEVKNEGPDGRLVILQAILEKNGILPHKLTGPNGELIPGPLEVDPEGPGYRTQKDPALEPGRPLVEGMVGRFSLLHNLRESHDDLTPHHMPQAARNFTSRADGGAIMMRGWKHELTRTYGWRGKITAEEEQNLSFRDTLARDIRDYRRIEGPAMDPSIRGLIRYYQVNFPALMAK